MVWSSDTDHPNPGDNPVYMLATEDNSVLYDVIGQSAEEERLFKNPMYGNVDPQQYEVPVHRATPTKEAERIFENPMYTQPDPAAYEVPVHSPQAESFLLQTMTTPTSSKQQRGLSVSNAYEEPIRPPRTYH